MSHKKTCTCSSCTAARIAKAREKADREIAAEQARNGHQQHILALGDRAIEVVQVTPGTWHVIEDGVPGPPLEPDVLHDLLARAMRWTGRAIAARSEPGTAGVTGPSVSGGSYGPYPGPGTHGLTPRQADDITSALDQGDREAAAIMLELSGPLGLSAAEMARLVPDRAPGTCVSCRLPLSPRDGAVRCAWCLALHDLMPRSRPPVPPVVSAETVRRLLAQGKSQAQVAEILHLPQRTVAMYARHGLPRPAGKSLARPLLLLTWAALCWYLASHGVTWMAVPTVIFFVTFIMATRPGRGR